MPHARITWQGKQGPGGTFHPSIDVIPLPVQARLSLPVMSLAWVARTRAPRQGVGWRAINAWFHSER